MRRCTLRSIRAPGEKPTAPSASTLIANGTPELAVPAAGTRGDPGPRTPGSIPGLRVWAALVALLVCTTLAFALFRPVQVLPLLRPAPPVALADAAGAPIVLARLAGTILIFQFSALQCARPCDDGHQAFQQLQQRLAAKPLGVPVRLVTVMLDGQGRPRQLAERSASMGADPRWWRLATGDATRLKDVVGGGFGVYYGPGPGGIVFDPATIVVDERGIVRAEYRTASPDAGLVLRDAQLIAREAASRGASRTRTRPA
ncbi:MAG TPA: SCO family protein [bacterium]|nr:SCO family protein [bacterium]